MFLRLHIAACVALAVLAAPAMAAGADAPAGGKGQLVLSESSYCRSYYQFGYDRIDAAALKAEGEKVLGKGRMGRLEKDTKRLLRGRQIDWSQQDWRDHAVCRYVTISHTLEGSTDRLEATRTLPPPADWFGEGFDDSGWMRYRRPFAVGPNAGMYFAQWSMASPGLQAAFLRFRFELPEPAGSGEWTLEADYVGGIRVLLNGRDVARGHLPDGPLDADTVAPGYGQDAYLGLFSELPEDQQRKLMESTFKGKSPPQYHGYADWRTPAGSRIYKARNRTLGPLKLPAGLLRKGRNVLAVEVRAAGVHPAVYDEHAWISGYGHSSTWLHASLSRLRLRTTAANVPSTLKRPDGMQVWSEDMHRRVFSPEYLEGGTGRGTVRIVAARNGSYGAQIVVGTEGELSGVTLRPGELKGPDGKALPPESIRVFGMAGHPAEKFTDLGGGRIPTSENFYTGGMSCFPHLVAADRFGRPETGLKGVSFFDQITRRAPERIPADSCQPYWLSFSIPADAAPGRYAGWVRVAADGVEPVSVPVEVEVLDWRLPDPLDLQTVMAVEQSPYGVAKAYNVPLWSAEHFRLVEASIAQLARIGNDWWFVPVILGTEFGNGEDSMIRWRRPAAGKLAGGNGGGLAFDFSILDRYLDLIGKHCGRPRVVSFVVMHGAPGPQEVDVLDEATGKTQRLRLGGPNTDPLVREQTWRVFAQALYEHMKARGLGEAMHWGYAWDTEGDPPLKPLLRAAVPEVYWTYGSHSPGGGSGGRMALSSLDYYKSVVEIYGFRPELTSRMGWKRQEIRALNPRVLSSCHTTEGHSPPFNYRLMVDRALVSGYNGLGRIGGDYWGSYYDGCRVSAYHLAGFSIMKVLWPGEGGAEPSARFEAMLEGMQETEARIFIEQALDRALVGEELARRAEEVLAAHNRETLYIPVHASADLLTEAAYGWQERSRRLYQAAAEVASAVAVDVQRTELEASLPALGEAQVDVKLRNWTGRPRNWKAATTQPWIRPSASQGLLAAQQTLPVVLDGRTLKPDAVVAGTLTITDVATGADRPVRIEARVVRPVELVAQSDIYNVVAGASDEQTFLIRSRTAAEQAWKLECSVPWIRAEPASGRLAGGGTTSIRVVAAPTDSAGALHRALLTLSAGQGKVTITKPLHVFVFPQYKPPKALPGGKAMPLHVLHKQLLVSHRSMNRFRHQVDTEAAFTPVWSFWHSDKPAQIGRKRYDMALWVLPRHQTVYKLEGRGVKGFSAEVGVNAIVAKEAAGHESLRVCFEVHVDGRLAAHSGLMKSTDEARLLAVEGLEKARQVKLITRLDTMLYDDESYRGESAYCNWGNPTLYK